MHTSVFVLVPYEVPPLEINDYLDVVLEPYRRTDSDSLDSHGKFDYLVGNARNALNDPISDECLPPKVRRSLSGRICEIDRIPQDAIPGALITLDGKWHDIGDFGWRMTREPCFENREAFARWCEHFRSMVQNERSKCRWLVEVIAHS